MAGRGLSVEEEALLKAASRQLALSLERERLELSSREAGLLRESEQLHQALLNSISHELRTPLTALLGSAAALQEDSTASDPEKRRALLDDVNGAGARLNRVIENLLDMARLNSGMLALKKEWHDPCELCRLTLQRLKSPLAQHRLKLELPEGMPLIQVDYRFMEHALSNLLINAAAYSPPGGSISLSARKQPGWVELSVADEGPGIPPEGLERVFEKFYRLPGSPAGGTGLGLYITQSLVQGPAAARPGAANLSGGGAGVHAAPAILEDAPAPPAEARL